MKGAGMRARGRNSRVNVGDRAMRRAGLRRGTGVLLTAALAILASGCGSSSSNTTTAATTAPSPAATSATTATTKAVAPASSESDLSGKWNGQYSGAYNGTFVLNWQQSGSTLSGEITLSAPQSTLSIHGALHGSSITFGTVGSLAITYTGTVSGSSMSGKYSTPGGGGTWSASKSS